MEDSNVPLDNIVKTILGSALDYGVKEVHIQRERLDAPVQEEFTGFSMPLRFMRNEGAVVSFRVADGLEKQLDLPHFVLKPLLARIQELGDTKVSEQHVFPEGHLQFEHGSRRSDWQVLVGPNELGEKVVLRQTSS